MAMKTKQIGSILVHQVVEMENVPIQAGSIFPGFRPDMAVRAREWLGPRFIAPDSDTLYLSFHSFVIQSGGRNILVDTCHGNHKQGREGTFAYYNNLQSDFLAILARCGL